MRRYAPHFGLLVTAVTLVLVGGSSVFASPMQVSPGTHYSGPVSVPPTIHTNPSSTPTNSSTTGSTSSDPSSSAGDSNTTSTPANKNDGKTGLAATQLKVCQGRQNAITNIMARIADRGQKQLTLFSTIATRTEAFYTSKGVTLSNYDALVADVNAKQATAQTAVDALKTASAGFSCDGTDPAGSVASFQSALKSEVSALEDYRTAVKNLIEGVKSVVSTTTSSSATTDGGNK